MDSRIQHIVEKWYLSEIALFQIFGTHNLERNDTISCPFRCGRGIIEYNQQIVDSLPEDEVELYLKAEIIRILLKHPYDRQPDGCKRDSMSAGSDLVLSDNYDFERIKLRKPTDYNLEGNQSYEWYSYRVDALSYHEQSKETENDEENNSHQSDSLEDIDSMDNQSSSDDAEDNSDSEEVNTNDSAFSEEIEIQLPNGSIIKIPSKADSNKQSKAKNPTDADNPNQEREEENRDFNSTNSDFDKSALWEEDALMSSSIDIEIDNIEASQSWGSLAGSISGMILANTKAKIDYRKVLAGFRASVLSSKRHLTRMRPNRRTGFENMGSIRRFDTNILVAVDVSGSVDDDSLRHFFSIINKAFKYGIENIDTIQFDTEVKMPVKFEKAQKEIKILGRGGTSFQPVFNYAAEHPEYDGLIIFTDGGAPKPVKPKGMTCKVAWVCDTQKNYESNKQWMREFGRSCAIKI